MIELNGEVFLTTAEAKEKYGFAMTALSRMRREGTVFAVGHERFRFWKDHDLQKALLAKPFVGRPVGKEHWTQDKKRLHVAALKRRATCAAKRLGKA